MYTFVVEKASSCSCLEVEDASRLLMLEGYRRICGHVARVLEHMIVFSLVLGLLWAVAVV